MNTTKNRQIFMDDLVDLSPWSYEDKSINLEELKRDKAKSQNKKNLKKNPIINKKGYSLKAMKGISSLDEIRNNHKKQQSLLKTIQYELPPLIKKQEQQILQHSPIITPFDKILENGHNKKLTKQKSNRKLGEYSVSTFVNSKKMSKFRLKGIKFNPSERTVTNRWIDRDQAVSEERQGYKKHIPANTIMTHKNKQDIWKKVLGQLHPKMS